VRDDKDPRAQKISHGLSCYGAYLLAQNLKQEFGGASIGSIITVAGAISTVKGMVDKKLDLVSLLALAALTSRLAKVIIRSKLESQDVIPLLEGVRAKAKEIDPSTESIQLLLLDK
jgi:hypothetical protein